MFYVSSLKGDKIGITDTSDNIEEFYTNKQIVDIVEKKLADIYGVSVFNHKADCDIIILDVLPSKSKLVFLLDKWKEVHNQWTGISVENYLSSLKIGVCIKVSYICTSSSGTHRRGLSTITRLSYDEWLFEDTDNVCSGDKGNSRFAAWALEVAYIYNRCVSLSIEEK